MVRSHDESRGAILDVTRERDRSDIVSHFQNGSLNLKGVRKKRDRTRWRNAPLRTLLDI